MSKCITLYHDSKITITHKATWKGPNPKSVLGLKVGYRLIRNAPKLLKQVYIFCRILPMFYYVWRSTYTAQYGSQKYLLGEYCRSNLWSFSQSIYCFHIWLQKWFHPIVSDFQSVLISIQSSSFSSMINSDKTFLCVFKNIWCCQICILIW